MKNPAYRLAYLFIFLFSATPILAQEDSVLAEKLNRLNAYPDLIVTNGKITTMDRAMSEVEAMAVRDGRILALGSNDDVLFLSGPSTRILDVKGKRVLPGLIDGHTHPHLWAVEHWLGAEGEETARRYNDLQLKMVYATGDNEQELLTSLERVIRQRAQELGPGKWIWVVLFAKDDVAESRNITWPMIGGSITKEFLDRLAPDNPTMVYGNTAIAPSVNNTLAAQEMTRLLGREMFQLPARTGVLYDILFRKKPEVVADFLKRELLTCVAPQGITTFGNHYYGTPSIMKATRLLYERGELPTRWAWWWGTIWNTKYGGGAPGEQDDFSPIYRYLGDFRGIGNDYIWNAGVSNETWEDRSPNGFSCTTAEAPPGVTPPVTRTTTPCPDQINFEQSSGYRNVRSALESGLRIGFLHGYTDGTYDGLFRLIEEAIGSGNVTLDEVKAVRISLDHNPIIRPDQAQKMAYYGIMPGFNGYQVRSWSKGGIFLSVFGEEYMKWIAPVRTLVKAGVHVVFNTDAHLTKVPLQSKDMDYPDEWDGSYWAFLEFFLTRRMPDQDILYNQAEALDRITLMKAATIWGAEQLLREDQIGSLETGKLGDFIVIDKDYFTIPADEVHTIKTLLTVVGGEIVYQAEGAL